MARKVRIKWIGLGFLVLCGKTYSQYINPFQFSNYTFLMQRKSETNQIREKILQLEKLTEALLFYQSIDETKFHRLKYPGIVLKLNDSGEYILQLKKKLQVMGLLDQKTWNSIYDDTLFLAVKKFQQMHNLTSDGIVGKNTYLLLNKSIREYIKTLETNIKRYNQRLDTLPKTRIEINIPEYTLRYYHKGTLTCQFKVVVGKNNNKTPVLSSEIDYLVFNPCWTVPRSIAVKKILPRLKSDASYLDRCNMFVCINGVRQDHQEIDFSAYTVSNFPYKIYQNASSSNALGKVKFMFNNSYTVYLHDTPSKYLFKQDFRNFSNGCIRVNQALKLAEAILRNDENRASIKNKLAPGYPIKVYLNTAIPIIIQYFTARYNSELGLVQFYRDCYFRD